MPAGTIREGILFTSALILLAVSGVTLVFMSLIAGLVVLLMTAAMTNRNTALHALAYLILAAVAAGLALRTLDPVLLLGEFGILGVFFGLCFKNRVAYRWTLNIGVVLAVILVYASLGLNYLLTGQDPFDISALIAAAEPLSETMEQAMSIMAVVMPGSLVVWAMAVAFGGFFLTGSLLHRLSFIREPLPDFTAWRLPWYVIWGLIGGLILLLTGDRWTVEWVDALAKNLLFVTVFGLFLAGLSLSVFLYRSFPPPRWMKIALVLTVLIYSPVVVFLVANVGFVDAVIDVRSRVEKRSGES
ncbi:MAG: DUF2232 domain-containing protein [Eubacteriales bacterium]|jgi:uncharacterized protein YybS (DUF2232 family)|nr:YybS family protein [Bacillota bacterium]MBV1727561.1 YybS family protein [Desulforudis sp.]MDQ7790061.1 DUF2232 domain-containing protein [Clostridia bacterium]MDZ4043885.1 DUF2232 domain-containing protein [Eubacteriales bacterium]MBU4534135.1 YybS family protein [Bacillota bacterium]